MGDLIFYGVLILVAASSAAWLLYDFYRRFQRRVVFPARPSSADRPPSWMRKDCAAHRLSALPPTLGPARLPSFARSGSPAPTGKPAPRRTQRPRRPRTSSLNHAV
jgi:hypothetical protein